MLTNILLVLIVIIDVWSLVAQMVKNLPANARDPTDEG